MSSTKRPAIRDNKEKELEEKTDILRYDFLIFEKSMILGLVFSERRERPNVMDVGSIELKCLILLLMRVM